MFLDNCIQCIYNIDCPCGYSLHNAACLTIADDNMENLTIEKRYKMIKKIDKDLDNLMSNRMYLCNEGLTKEQSNKLINAIRYDKDVSQC